MAGTQILTNDNVIARFVSLESRLAIDDTANKETFGILEANLKVDSDKLMKQIAKIEEDVQKLQQHMTEQTRVAKYVAVMLDTKPRPLTEANVLTSMQQSGQAMQHLLSEMNAVKDRMQQSEVLTTTMRQHIDAAAALNNERMASIQALATSAQDMEGVAEEVV